MFLCFSSSSLKDCSTELVSKQVFTLKLIFLFCLHSKLEVSLPDIDYIEIPASWWDADADKSLLIGVHKHGEHKSPPSI